MTKETVNIHGKQYETVASRVHRFREDYKGDETLPLVTELVSNDSEYVVMKASILSVAGQPIATGFAQEKYGATNINKTSALENCETSAIGRALACFGYMGTEFASADEVATAVKQQSEGTEYKPSNTKPASEKQRGYIDNLFEAFGIKTADAKKEWLIQKGYTPGKLTSADASDIIEALQS